MRVKKTVGLCVEILNTTFVAHANDGYAYRIPYPTAYAVTLFIDENYEGRVPRGVKRCTVYLVTFVEQTKLDAVRLRNRVLRLGGDLRSLTKHTTLTPMVSVAIGSA